VLDCASSFFHITACEDMQVLWSFEVELKAP